MKSRELRDLSDSDLLDKLSDERAGLAKLQFTHTVSSLENPMEMRNKRRNIARIMGEMNARNKKA
jgi:large subunit ribosomal protein L29